MKKLNSANIAFKVIALVAVILNLAVSILYILFAVANTTNEFYEFTSKYGPYFIIGLGALLFVAIVVLFILQLAIKSKEKKLADAAAAALANMPAPEPTEPKEPEELSYSGVIKQRLTAIKIRLDVLDEVKTSNVLTQTEYEEKRKEIIDELKI